MCASHLHILVSTSTAALCYTTPEHAVLITVHGYVQGHNRVRTRTHYDVIHPSRVAERQLWVNEIVAKLMYCLPDEIPFECTGCGAKASKIIPVFPACCPDVGVARLCPRCREPACGNQSSYQKLSPFAVQCCSPVALSSLACAVCVIVGHSRICSRCKLIAYCGRSCHKLDWPHHKAECTAAHKSHGHAKTLNRHTTWQHMLHHTVATGMPRPRLHRVSHIPSVAQHLS